MTHTTVYKRFALVAISLIGSFACVYALTISPARTELNADPDTTVTGEFLVINDQDSTQTFYTSAENFEAQGESGTPSFSPSKEGLASWIRIEEKVTLEKGQRLKIPYSVTVPKNADAGGHFAAIFLSTIPPSAKGGSVSVGAKVGMLVLLRVNGDIKEGGGVISFAPKDTRFITSLPMMFVYRFNNSGNDRVNPIGEIVIRDTIGLKAAVIGANPASGNILPGSTRRFEVPWGDKELPVDATFMDHVTYEISHFAFGFYTAKLNLTFGSSGSSSDSTWFFVFPWHLLVVVAIIALILWYVIKRYNRWIIKQAQLSK